MRHQAARVLLAAVLLGVVCLGGCASDSGYGAEPGWDWQGSFSSEEYVGSAVGCVIGLAAAALVIPALGLYGVFKILSEPLPWDTD